MSRTTLRSLARTAAAAAALTFGAGAAVAQAPAEAPKYGGTLNVATVYYTISALTWNPADWNWKANHDTGQYFEQLFAADLSKSRKAGGKHPFYADAYLPLDAIRGELAETWQSAAPRDQAAQGGDVPREEGRDGVARAGRR